MIHDGVSAPRLLNGPFEGHERDSPIHVKECLAALFMLRASGVHDAYVNLYTDNMSVFHSLTKFHSKHKQFGPCIQAVVMFCVENNVSLRVQWLSSEDNAIADEQSRTLQHTVDKSDVTLQPGIVVAAQHWAQCVCDVDICSTPANRQMHRFISRAQWSVDGQCGVDCMAANLGTLRGADGSRAWLWCHPPWGLIGPMWSHLRHQHCRGLMIIPQLEQEPWFPCIMHDCLRRTVLADIGDVNVLWGLPPTNSGSDLTDSDTILAHPRVCKGPLRHRLWCVLFDF